MSMQDQSRTSSSKNYTSEGSSGKSNSGIQDTTVKAQQKTGEILDQATDKVGEVAGKVKDQASSQIASQKDKAADSLGNVAEAIRQTGDQLRQKEQVAPVAQYTDQLAQGVEMVSNYLKSKSLSDIVSEVERFARREPALFLGGALTVGLLAGRFLRSSGANQSQGSSTTALARSYNTSTDSGTYGSYGSRGTGYSTALASDVQPGYSSLDMPNTGSPTGSYGSGSEGYEGLITSEPADYGLTGSTTSGSDYSTGGYNTGTSTGGYSSNYPADDLTGGSQSYGSQGRTGGKQSGGPLGNA